MSRLKVGEPGLDFNSAQFDFLVEEFNRPPLPGSGDTLVARLIPPRETITDPRRLENFFTQLSSLVAQLAGQPRLAGGRTLTNSSARKTAARRMERRAFLGQEDKVGGAGKSDRGLAETAALMTDPAIRARLKTLARRHHPQWDWTVSLEIAGAYQQLSFLLRTNRPEMLEECLRLLRHEYPHLLVERLSSEPVAAYRLHRNLSFSQEGLKEWRKFDPLLFADDPASQVAQTGWLALSEHPALPLELAGKSNRVGERENTPLRSLLAALSGLKPGEVVVAQLLVFGPAPKEWSKAQEGLALALRAAGSEQAPPTPQAKRQREGVSEHGRRYRPDSSSRTTSQRRPGGNCDRPNPWLFLSLLTLVGGGFGLWLFYRDFIGGPLAHGETLTAVINTGLALVGLVVSLFFMAALWWFMRRKGRPGEVLSPLAIETKISCPVSLAALRLVTSVRLEPYLRQAVTGSEFLQHFGPGEQARARTLYRLRNSMLEQIGSGAANVAGGSGLKIKPEDPAIWEMVQELALAGAEERGEQLLQTLAGGYAAYQNGSGNAFVAAPPQREIQVFSSLHPLDWPDPECLREGFVANLWPFNSRLFDALANLGRREIPAEIKAYPGLGLFNSAELAALWHLPGGLEEYPFLERSGAKEIGPAQTLLECTGQADTGAEGWASAGLGLLFEVKEEK